MSPQNKATADSSARKVLVVDDEYSIRITFEAFLQQEGLDVRTAMDQQGATAALEAEAFDLVLMDIVLGEGDGLELLAECRTLQPQTPVVMITGRPSLDTATASVRLGAFDYLLKPVERDELLRVCSRALKHKALLDEKRVLQRELEESERKYRLLAENVGDVIWVMDANRNFTYFSPAVERMIGLTPEEVLELGAQYYIELQPPEKQRQWTQWVEDELAGRGQGVAKLWELQAPDRSGNTIWIETLVRPMLEDGVCTGFLGVSRDVTERRQAQDALAKAMAEKEDYRRNLDATFRSIPDAIVTVDRQMRIISFNEAAGGLCGNDVALGRQFADLPGCNGAPCREVMRRTLETQETVRSQMVACSRDPERVRHLELNCAPLLSADREQRGAVLVIKDVTRLLDLEQRLLQRSSFHKIIGRSRRMQEVFSLIEQLGAVDSTVLLQGETGTGKELVCDALHHTGARAQGPLVKVNCSALSESLLESELFGHVRGAFTGAVRDKEGRIQAASGGTLMLDEIGDISPLIQLKLLRFLEQKEYERVGESRTRKADVRVIAASNVDLLQQTRAGRFREDLFYRLNVMVISLPPLRERTEDIPLLAEHFLRHFGQEFGKRFAGLAQDTLQTLLEYSWPGNIRELKHTLEHACILCPGDVIRMEHLPAELLERKRQVLETAGGSRRSPVGRQEIENALRQAEGNKARAARLLGIDRTTLYRKMSRYGMALH